MSCESTALYYKALNNGARERLGGLHSARTVLFSFDFPEIETLQRDGKWEDAAEAIAKGLDALARAGADLALIGSVTGQRDWEYLLGRSPIPLVCVREAMRHALGKVNAANALLLGTRYTMEQPYFREPLAAAGIRIDVPEESLRERIHRIIYHELCIGVVRDESRDVLYEIASAYGGPVILGCTELPMLLDERIDATAFFDIVTIHADAALDQALAPQ